MKRYVVLGLLCMGALASAQTAAPDVIGKVTDVVGVVTVSDGVTVATAVIGTLITEGNRFVTASSGAARLTLDNGCEISLKANESVLVDSRKSCKELFALIEPSGTAVAGVGPGGFAVGGAILAALLAGGGGGGSGGASAGGAGGAIPVIPISGQ